MKRIKRLFRSAVAALLCAALLMPPQAAFATWDPAKAVHIDPQTIESSTIAVGTHLIHLSAMTDMLYAEALRTAGESGQSAIFYKSELADGGWFDITGASGIADISTSGVPVPNKTIAAIYFTHHTKSDGVTYDLRTNSKVYVFDIHNPYELDKLDELRPYQNQLEYLSQTPMYAETYRLMTNMSNYGKKFIHSPKEYPQITDIWYSMATLDDYQQYLRQKNASVDELNIVQQAIDYQNAERWSWIFEQVDNELLNVSNKLIALNDPSAQTDDEEEDEEEKAGKNVTPQSTLDSLGESQMLVKSALIKWKGKRLVEGTMVVEQYRYNYFNELIKSISGEPIANPPRTGIVFKYNGEEIELTRADLSSYMQSGDYWTGVMLYGYYIYDYDYLDSVLKQNGSLPDYFSAALYRVVESKSLSSYYSATGASQLLQDMDAARKRKMGYDAAAADPAIANLMNLERIENSDIVNRADELAMLTDNLAPSATEVYMQRLRAGVNADYDDAIQNTATQALIDTIVKTNAASVGMAQTELEYFLEEMLERMSRTDGIAFFDARLAEARGYYKPIPKDDFQVGAKASVDAHIEFLTRMRNKAAGEDSNAQNKLAGEKADLQTQLMGALDKNNLDDANALRAKITALDDKLSGMEDDQAGALSAQADLVTNLEGQLKDAENRGDTALADSLGDQLGDARGQLAGMGSGLDNGASGRVAQLKKDGLAAIAGGDTSGIDNSLSGLIGIVDLDARLAYPAIAALRDAMANKRKAGDDTLGSLIYKAEGALGDSAGRYNAGKAGNGGAKELMDQYDPNAHQSNAATLGALGQLGYGDAELMKLLSDWADKLFKDGNPYVYIRYDDGVNEYIPCSVLCRYTNMRYVWQQSTSTGTMSKKGNYYSFVVDSDKVSRDKLGAKTDKMAKTAKWQDAVHVYEEYTMAQFNAEAYYLPSTRYGVLLTPEIKEMLAELLGTLKGVS